MGTLTSCSLGTLNLNLNLNPNPRSWPAPNSAARRAQANPANQTPNKSLCFLCRKREELWYSNFNRFRCRSSGDDNNPDSNLKETNSPPEVANKPSDDVDSDKKAFPISAKLTVSPIGNGYNDFQLDSFKLMELLGPEKVDPADIKLIKDKLFGYSTFWVTKEKPFGEFGEGTLFVGNLRANREELFVKFQKQVVEVTGDKYNLFMVEEPNAEDDDPRGGPRVSFGLLRKEVSEPVPTTLWQYVISLLLFVLTIGSSVELGIASQINRLPPEVAKYFTDQNAVAPPDMDMLLPYVDSALPLAYGVLGILIFHEVGHFLAAYPKKVKLSIPFLIPNITLGSFGAITQFKSIIPDRSTKVDISLAGPFAGAALSVSMFAVGLLLSSKPDVAGDLVQVPSMLFQGSLLLGLISRAYLGYTTMHAATVSIHPLVIAGWCGLTTTAFNMLPVGCLDGGRAMQGAFGKTALTGFSLATYLMLGLGVVGGPLSLPWGIYVLICQRDQEKACLNNVSEVGMWRKTAVVVATFLVLFTLLPVGDELAEEIGIGLVNTVL